ncbi:glutathione S-transferase-like isoform X1 [Schistocerca gregaria]|uniref:glutathione S-transferase-like isoform X1 n=2 Tax=Schistocerca gregaria TaxID=7010 RepID=UPI00211EED2F|nr:glutathione S-transferase-like isoform X1 [Schistocerca gregaria]
MQEATPFGQLPVLEIDEKKTWQSHAICRYLGKQMGLAGANDWENLQIDMAADTISDIRMKMVSPAHETDETLKQKKKAAVINESLPFLLPRLDKMVKENGGYLANSKLSWADLYFVALIDYLKAIIGFDITKGYSNLAALEKTVLEIPAVE